jgi:hypothetical protein
MSLQEINHELSKKKLEFEHAMEAGLPHSELIQIYNRLKELQYQLAMEQIKETETTSAETIA